MCPSLMAGSQCVYTLAWLKGSFFLCERPATHYMVALGRSMEWRPYQAGHLSCADNFLSSLCWRLQQVWVGPERVHHRGFTGDAGGSYRRHHGPSVTKDISRLRALALARNTYRPFNKAWKVFSVWAASFALPRAGGSDIHGVLPPPRGEQGESPPPGTAFSATGPSEPRVLHPAGGKHSSL